MIYKYGEHYINFDEVSRMELNKTTFDNDPALQLEIHMNNGKSFALMETARHYKDEMTGEFKVSLYPLDKLRRIPNTWMKHKNNQNLVVERTITKTGNTEIIHEKLLYNSKEPDLIQSAAG
jgi:hypothetical protein